MSDTCPGSADEKSSDVKENNFQSYWDQKLEDLKNTEDGFKSLSKNQQKKLLKKKLMLETRLERRKKEKERKKLKRAERKEAGLPPVGTFRVRKRKKVECSNYIVAIDLDFYGLMEEREHRMVLKQLKSCYSENRRSQQPLQLCCTSFDTELKDLFLKLQPGILNWSLRMQGKCYGDVFDHDKIVYLTSDSENVLETLEEGKVYIIGGLVDHNHHKGLCYQRAEEKGFAHAQLPIGQYVKMSTRKVLTINHVFEILLTYSITKDWKDAFFKVLPNRKGVSELDEGKVDDSDVDADENDPGSDGSDSAPDENDADNDQDDETHLPIESTQVTPAVESAGQSVIENDET